MLNHFTESFEFCYVFSKYVPWMGQYNTGEQLQCSLDHKFDYSFAYVHA